MWKKAETRAYEFVASNIKIYNLRLAKRLQIEGFSGACWASNDTV